MAVEDYVQPEVAIAVAATALVTSPRLRGLMRRGLVYGLAGVLKARDAVDVAARDIRAAAERAAVAAAAAVQEANAEANEMVATSSNSQANEQESNTVGG